MQKAELRTGFESAALFGGAILCGVILVAEGERRATVLKLGTRANSLNMRLEIFSLCDAATEHAGKLNLVGTFDSLAARETPVAHPTCAIAARIRFERIEEGAHRLSLTFADEDGHMVMPRIDSTLTVQFRPGQRTSTSHFVMVIQQIRLPRFGEYTIDLAVDGHHLGSLPLYVSKLEVPPTTVAG